MDFNRPKSYVKRPTQKHKFHIAQKLLFAYIMLVNFEILPAKYINSCRQNIKEVFLIAFKPLVWGSIICSIGLFAIEWCFNGPKEPLGVAQIIGYAAVLFGLMHFIWLVMVFPFIVITAPIGALRAM